MGRNVKPGISFYRMDSGHILNKKVRLLCNEFDSDGYYIWSCLIDYAYLHNGYYFDLNDKEAFELFASEYCKKKATLVTEVIKGCVRRGLFDKDVADSFNILTCEMMQEVFLFATSERRAKGSEFEMHNDWLLLDFNGDVPRNIKILPGKKEKIPLNNPQTKQNNTETKQNVLAHEAPAHEHPSDKISVKTGAEGQDARRKKFIPPTLQQAEDYFIGKMYNPKAHNTVFPDVCRREAADFYDFYQSNGWVQGRGAKKIVSWEAAANRWIRNRDSFNHPPAAAVPVAPVAPMVPVMPPPSTAIVRPSIETEINYLFERFMEDPEKVTIISMEVTHYDYLKRTEKISFSEDIRTEIANRANEIIKEKNLDRTDHLLNVYMKKIGVLEYFKQLSKQGSSCVFAA